MRTPTSPVDRLLRQLIREILNEGPTGPGVTADPTSGTSGGARDYELQRGVDIYGYWYRSPGELGGSGIDPMRPEDPEEYLGMTGSGTTPEEVAGEEAPPPVMAPPA